MTRLPRDISGAELIKRLKSVGYVPTRQTGSHVRMTLEDAQGQHHITIPLHNWLKVGTLAGILDDVSDRLKIDREELLRRVFK